MERFALLRAICNGAKIVRSVLSYFDQNNIIMVYILLFMSHWQYTCLMNGRHPCDRRSIPWHSIGV